MPGGGIVCLAYAVATVVAALAMLRRRPTWSRTRIVMTASLPVPALTFVLGIGAGVFFMVANADSGPDAGGIALFAMTLVSVMVASTALAIGLASTAVAMILAR
jgi:hypothetical protein